MHMGVTATCLDVGDAIFKAQLVATLQVGEVHLKPPEAASSKGLGLCKC